MRHTLPALSLLALGLVDRAGAATLQAAWLTTGEERSDYGWSLLGAVDVNGDGFDDFVVGAPETALSEADEGAAYLYLGSASGLSTVPAWIGESDVEFARYGTTLAAGDLNGDGFGDIAVGAPQLSDGELWEGRVYVYFGSAAGLNVTAGWVLDGNVEDANFGRDVDCPGDVDGDGFDDLVVGAVGIVQLHPGSPTGPAVTPTWTVTASANDMLLGDLNTGAGDVNGDGLADVIVISRIETEENFKLWDATMSVYHGAFTGLAPLPTTEIASADVYMSVNSPPITFWSPRSAGDVNGDGFGDVAVSDLSRAFVYEGSAAGLVPTHAWTAAWDQLDESYGYAVGGAGDTNGDGYDDVVVGAPFFYLDPTYVENVGRFELILGSATGLEPAADGTFEGNDREQYVGLSVATAGDVNADGADDFAVGIPGYGTYDYAGIGGAVAVFEGNCGVQDSDGDTILDLCDRCPGYDDRVDGDADGTADGCDGCPADAASSDPDRDGDGACPPTDCDDADTVSFPGATELCDGKDNACAGAIPADEIPDGDGDLPCEPDEPPPPPGDDDDDDDDDDGGDDDSGGCTCGGVGSRPMGATSALLIGAALLLQRRRRTTASP